MVNKRDERNPVSGQDRISELMHSMFTVNIEMTDTLANSRRKKEVGQKAGKGDSALNPGPMRGNGPGDYQIPDRRLHTESTHDAHDGGDTGPSKLRLDVAGRNKPGNSVGKHDAAWQSRDHGGIRRLSIGGVPDLTRRQRCGIIGRYRPR